MAYILEPYDNTLKNILENGRRVKNRTGIDTIRLISVTARYDISKYFPILTRRKMYPKAVFAELLWMLSGSTNNDDLIKLGANFWTPWVEINNPENKVFYEKTGLPVGYLGPVYGWQLRHFGGDYKSFIKDDYTADPGFDQISWLVNEIKTNPASRRLIVSMWNPKDMHMARLPPCHFVFQIFIDQGTNELSLLLDQRSVDSFIGAPANIQFYSALCYMLSQQTGYKPKEFIHHMQDAHIYINHLDQVNEYLSRDVKDSPKLILNQAKDIFSYKMDDFILEGYSPQPPIKAPVAV